MKRTKLAGAIAASAFLLTWYGCSGHRRAVPSVASLPQQDAQAVGSAQYDVAAGGRIEIYHQGYGVRSVQGVPVGTMRIQLSIRNDGDGALTFDASRTHLVDSLGDTLHLGALRRDGQPTPSLVEVDAGTHAQVDLFFDLPEGYALAKVENFRVYWGHAVGDQQVATETLFVRKDPGNMFWLDGRGKKRPYRYFMAVKV